MNAMIEIRSFFQDWKEVSEEQAINYVLALRNSLPGIERDKRDDFINQKRLRGITVEELLSRSSNSKST